MNLSEADKKEIHQEVSEAKEEIKKELDEEHQENSETEKDLLGKDGEK